MRILMILIPDREPGPEAPEVDQGDGPVLRLERFIGPYYVFRDADAEIALASPEGGYPWMGPASADRAIATPAMRRFRDDRSARDELTDTLALDQVYSSDFDGAFCVGSAGAVWLAGSPTGGLIGQFLAAGKPVAIIPSQIDLAPNGIGDGLLITVDRPGSPILAAHALLGALASPP